MYCATGGAWGGTYVDQNFINLLKEVFGENTIKEYRTEYPGDWVDWISRKFERSKRTAEQGSTTCVEIPFSFGEFLKNEGSSVKNCIAAMEDDNLKFRNGFLAMKYPTVEKLFKPVLTNIAEHLRSILGNVGKVNYLILVGGFASSKLVQDDFRRQFERPFNLQMIVPLQCHLAVVMGAVLFGHNPAEIAARRARYSYGVEVADPCADPNKQASQNTRRGLPA
eukprot:m.313298 g.313298  ORF g.313298 m.313298 type:complete len:223 (+) comp373473_c0_seq1:104-772(+)